ncbi:MAG TPA: LamG-like jellyroll fold domain-containing protein [Candidatus Saccharimonadales bacterium]|nr:LamG-like jellyroll fold domain-containing protein [Candidatus Saccharimonadales bacterium]
MQIKRKPYRLYRTGVSAKKHLLYLALLVLAVPILAILTTKSFAYAASGLIGQWKLDEGTGTTAADSSGNGNNGTIIRGTGTGSPSWVSPGHDGTTPFALDFDGSGTTATAANTVNLGNSPALDQMDNYTVSLWVKFKPGYVGTSGTWANLVGRNSSAANWAWMIYVNNTGHIRPHHRNSNGSFAPLTDSAAVIPVGQWTHIEQVADGGKLHLYINGVEDPNFPINYSGTTMSLPTANTYIGQDTREHAPLATISDVKIYNDAPMAPQVTTNTATNIADNSATLNGTLGTLGDFTDANVFYRYRVAGSTGPYSQTSPQPVTAAGSFSANVNGLAPGTQYEFLAVVRWQGRDGLQETTGSTNTFTTTLTKVHYRKTVNPVVTAVTPGQTFTYTVTVENQGTTNLTGLTFTDDLSNVIDDATYNNDVSATIGTPAWNGSNQISWGGNLNVGQTATITYSFTMNSPVTGDGKLNNGIVGTGPQSNCTASPAIDPECRTTTPLPVLTSQKTLVSPTNPKAGDTVNYQFVITNIGGTGASNVAVADDLSEVLDDAVYGNNASASTGVLTYNPVSKRIIWNGNLAASGGAGDSVTVTYSVKVNGASNLNDAVLNNALVSADCPLTPIFDSSAPGYKANCVTSTAVSAWTAQKTTLSPSSVLPGDAVNYVVTITNTGAVDLTNLTVDDTLSDVIDDASYNDDANATSGAFTYNAPSLIWTGDLAAGKTATLTYGATVNQSDHLANKALVNTITGSMNCPNPAITNPADSNFNTDCAVITQITSTPQSPASSDPDTLASTGQNLMNYVLPVTLFAAMGIGGLVLRRKRIV